MRKGDSGEVRERSSGEVGEGKTEVGKVESRKAGKEESNQQRNIEKGQNCAIFVCQSFFRTACPKFSKRVVVKVGGWSLEEELAKLMEGEKGKESWIDWIKIG